METSALSSPTLISAVVALSFAAGLNLYATILALGAMARLHWIVLPDGLGGLASPWVIAASGVLFAGEFVADKIPGFDIVWNVAHTFIRIPAAALMAYVAGSHLSPEMHALVTGIGIAVATAAHGSKTLVRVAVTPSPEPFSNIALSAGEDGAALGLVWLSLHFAAVAAGAAAALTVVAVLVVWIFGNVGYRTIRKFVRQRGRAEIATCEA